MPPLQALLALHGLWCLVFLPLVVGATCVWPTHRLRLVGMRMTLIAAIALAVFVGLQAFIWLPTVPSACRIYLPQRIVFAIATTPEVPLMQSLLASVTCWIAGRRRIVFGLLGGTA